MRIINSILLVLILSLALSSNSFAGTDTANEINYSGSFYVCQAQNEQVVQLLEDDLNGDGNLEILLLLKIEEPSENDYTPLKKIYYYDELKPLPPEVEKIAAEEGLNFANHLLILERDSAGELKEKNRIDLTPYRPLSIKTGDVNGDGKKEISVCMFKTTYYHPFFARRPFVYSYDEELTPLWQGSRLSKPFTDYQFMDINSDCIDELVSIEFIQTGEQTVNYYKWHDFGFIFLGESEAYEKIKSISPLYANGEFKSIEAAVVKGGSLEVIEIYPQISIEE